MTLGITILSIMIPYIMPLSMKAFSKTTLSILTQSIMTEYKSLSITTLSIMTQFIVTKNKSSQHNNT